MNKKEHLIFLLFFAAAVMFMFLDVLFLKVALIKGDYLQQFFPWSSLYSEGIKNMRLVSWAEGVQCGFPLFAEGQIGQLYPLNVLFFLVLPFRAAYNYSFLFHFILSGFFTYLYARSKGSDIWGGAFAAVTICFGSMYAGCFVNTAALKALTLFPAVLFMCDRYMSEGLIKYTFFAGLLAGMQFLAGSVQMAAYSVAFYLIYLTCAYSREKRPFFDRLKGAAAIVFTAFLTALPQLAPTLVLSAHSNRPERTLDFALWNSLSPTALAGTVMPYVGMIFARGNIGYIGVTGLFFAVTGIYIAREKKELRPMMVFLVISLFMALGKYNPIFTNLLKITGFYSFRAPSRFIYFGVFAMSILGGVGFTHFMECRDTVSRWAYKVFYLILAATTVFFVAVKTALHFLGPNVLAFAREYVKNHVYGKPFHRYSLDTYMARTEGYYNGLKEVFSFSDPYVLMGFLVLIMSGVFVYGISNTRIWRAALRPLAISFLCADLFIFSFFARGIWPELASFDYASPRGNAVYEAVRGGEGVFRICPFGDFDKMPLWLRPSMNTYYGIDSVAIYSPLMNKDYFTEMQGLGVVDDSVGIVPPENEALYSKIDLLRSLNVKYIVSTRELKDPSLKSLTREGDTYLYELSAYLPRFRFRTDTVGKTDIRVNFYASGRAELDIDPDSAGELIFSEKYYPGWRAYLDGTETKIRRYQGLMQSVYVPAGTHRVIFDYDLFCREAFAHENK